MERIDISTILTLPDKYPEEYTNFCKENGIPIPKIDCGRGKALALMLANPNKYFVREDCNNVCKKFNIESDDSIQLFNKFGQWVKTCPDKGKYNITYPYSCSNKGAMRKGFKYDGTEECKNNEINEIKRHIKSNYIDVPNADWQLGHKNPDSTDSSNNNSVPQPPIQGKYRDNYIFIDTLTKIPTPKKFIELDRKNECPYIQEQQLELYNYLKSKFN